MTVSYKFEFVMKYAKAELRGMKQRVPSRADLNRYFVGCGGPYWGYEPSVSWCGIFACYILRKAGLAVKWKMGRGIQDLSGGQDLKLIHGREGLAMGDVAVRGSGSHHFILLENPSEGQTVAYAVDGNAAGAGNPLLFCGYNPRDALSGVRFYYRIY